MLTKYRGACPVCGGTIDDERLSKGLPCRKCLKEEVPREKLVELDLGGPLGEYLKRLKELTKMEEIFSKVTKSVMWSAQRSWSVRVLRGESFAIVAPTGMGKSTFGAFISAYIASKGKKAYIVVPTTPLVMMMAERVKPFAEALGVKVVYVHSKLTPSLKKEMEKRIEEGDFDVLITTSQYMIRNLDVLRRFRYGLIFVDDVDSVLKSPKNVDRILILLGLNEEDIKTLEELDRELEALNRKLVFVQPTDPERVERRKEILKKIKELEAKVEELRKKVTGSVVVSSATGKARGKRVRLFTRLLSFTPGGLGEGLRNVVDSYTTKKSYVEVVKTLGKGGLVFVPVDWGKEGAERVAEELRSVGMRAEAVTSEKADAIELFARGELDVLVGVATHYGVLVRGIDLPHVIRYAVFTAVPRFKFKLKLEEPNPFVIYRLLNVAASVLQDKEVEALLKRLRRWMRELSPITLKSIEEKLKEGKAESPAERDFMEAYKKVKELVESSEFLERIKEAGEYEVKKEGEELYIYIPDPATYLQASGRTSRLYAGGITKGLSVVIVDSEPLFRGLKRRLKWAIDQWYEFESLDLEKLLKEIDEDREKVKKVLEGKLSADEIKNLMKTVLLIVESPNKARTISSFFGRPSVRTIGNLRVYEISLGDKYLYVAASGGHVYDLVGDSDLPCYYKDYNCLFNGLEVGEKVIHVTTSIKRCLACGHQFSEDVNSCPRCGSPFLKDSKDIIDGLRKIAEEVDLVLIGTDPDTEGEKIGWDVRNLVMPFAKKIMRAEFHEVTKRAILEAINNPKEFNINMVKSQMLRRAEDRLIGYTLSPKLWFEFWPWFCTSCWPKRVPKEIEMKILESLMESCDPNEVMKEFQSHCSPTRNLSAGRVQTPVLGWIIERYEAYNASKIRRWTFVLEGPREWTLEVWEDELNISAKRPKDLLGAEVRVEIVEERVEERNPLPPFTTDTLLEEADKRLKLDASTTMKLAQDLFEMGFITYHRTDSTRVSDVGIQVAKEWISERFGEQEFVPRRWGEGGAHEAIRPTKPLDVNELTEMIEEGEIVTAKELTRRHLALYDLIFRRFMASQMKPAKVKVIKYRISMNGSYLEREAIAEILEEGFLKVYDIIRPEEVPEPGSYVVKEARAVKRPKLTLPSQAEVIAMMKERGLGRPSTYAKIVSTLLERRYVMEVGRSRKLVPTRRGIGVYRYFTVVRKDFRPLVSEERTRQLEKYMDEVAEGKRDYWQVMEEILRETRWIPVKGSPLMP